MIELEREKETGLVGKGEERDRTHTHMMKETTAVQVIGRKRGREGGDQVISAVADDQGVGERRRSAFHSLHLLLLLAG